MDVPNRTLNSRINGIHERALRIVYRDKTSSFTELFQKKKNYSDRVSEEYKGPNYWVLLSKNGYCFGLN